jgi:hypothetical protein
MDSERKKELRKAFKDQELKAARGRMCLAPDQLRELRDYLDATISELGIPCDHTLSRATEWAKREGLEVERVLTSMRAFGGFCDCEVLFNVTPDKFGWTE